MTAAVNSQGTKTGGEGVGGGGGAGCSVYFARPGSTMGRYKSKITAVK